MLAADMRAGEAAAYGADNRRASCAARRSTSTVLPLTSKRTMHLRLYAAVLGGGARARARAASLDERAAIGGAALNIVRRIDGRRCRRGRGGDRRVVDGVPVRPPPPRRAGAAVGSADHADMRIRGAPAVVHDRKRARCRRARNRRADARIPRKPSAVARGHAGRWTPVMISSGGERRRERPGEEIGGRDRARAACADDLDLGVAGRPRCPAFPRPDRHGRGCRRRCRGCGSDNARHARPPPAAADAPSRAARRARCRASAPGAEPHAVGVDGDAVEIGQLAQIDESDGVASRNASTGIRLCPPASTFASPERGASSATASPRVVGHASSKRGGFMGSRGIARRGDHRPHAAGRSMLTSRPHRARDQPMPADRGGGASSRQATCPSGRTRTRRAREACERGVGQRAP